jgi:hypothetical protein
MVNRKDVILGMVMTGAVWVLSSAGSVGQPAPPAAAPQALARDAQQVFREMSDPKAGRMFLKKAKVLRLAGPDGKQFTYIAVKSSDGRTHTVTCNLDKPNERIAYDILREAAGKKATVDVTIDGTDVTFAYADFE